MRSLWPRWTLLPPAPFLVAGAFWIVHGGFRIDHLAMMVVLPVLPYISKGTKRFYVGMLPFFLVGLAYDGARVIKNWGLTASRVHTCDLWHLERTLFGIPTPDGRVAAAEYFHAHHWLWMDVLCAVPYATYFLIVLVYGAYLYFRDFGAMRRFGWSFLAMTMAGLVTFHLFPAAPPWYVQQHGCMVDLAIPNSPGEALLRVDAWLGLGFFQGLYSRASAVFGAMPSLHVAFPLLTVLAAWRHDGWLVRSGLVGFYLATCFAAVYLNHHWVADIVVGSCYACAARLLVWPLIRDPA